MMILERNHSENQKLSNAYYYSDNTINIDFGNLSLK